MLDNVRVIMFDWGGTLVHVARQDATRPLCVDAAIAFLRRAGVTLSDNACEDLRRLVIETLADREQRGDLRELDTRAMLAAWARTQGVAMPQGAFAERFAEAFWRPWVGCLELMGDTHATLRTLVSRGYVIGLVSNCAASPTCCRAETGRLGLAPLLAFSVFSSELGVRKPHEQVYRCAMERARVTAHHLLPEDVLFVGDTPSADIDGPARHGMRTALVRTGNGKGSTDQLMRQPDLILASIDELARLPGAPEALSGKGRTDGSSRTKSLPGNDPASARTGERRV